MTGQHAARLQTGTGGPTTLIYLRDQHCPIVGMNGVEAHWPVATIGHICRRIGEVKALEIYHLRVTGERGNSF